MEFNLEQQGWLHHFLKAAIERKAPRCQQSTCCPSKAVNWNPCKHLWLLGPISIELDPCFNFSK
jgi:hypothetical protein